MVLLEKSIMVCRRRKILGIECSSRVKDKQVLRAGKETRNLMKIEIGACDSCACALTHVAYWRRAGIWTIQPQPESLDIQQTPPTLAWHRHPKSLPSSLPEQTVLLPQTAWHLVAGVNDEKLHHTNCWQRPLFRCSHLECCTALDVEVWATCMSTNTKNRGDWMNESDAHSITGLNDKSLQGHSKFAKQPRTLWQEKMRTKSSRHLWSCWIGAHWDFSIDKQKGNQTQRKCLDTLRMHWMAEQWVCCPPNRWYWLILGAERHQRPKMICCYSPGVCIDETNKKPKALTWSLAKWDWQRCSRLKSNGCHAKVSSPMSSLRAQELKGETSTDCCQATLLESSGDLQTVLHQA